MPGGRRGLEALGRERENDFNQIIIKMNGKTRGEKKKRLTKKKRKRLKEEKVKKRRRRLRKKKKDL